MEEDNSIEEKQEYIRENILEKGFEANAFADYLVEQRGEEAANINNISMDDLRQAVKEFLEKIELDKKNNKKDLSSNSDEEEDKNENKKIEKENDNKINEKEKEDENEKGNEIIINEKEKESSKNMKKEEKESKKEQKKEQKKEPKKDVKKDVKKESKK